MLSRVTLLLITVFWLCMNFLLWRSEFGWRNHVGARVPVAVVWQKILTSPDNSTLQILHHGKVSGSCRWWPNIGLELTAAKILTEGIPLDGPVQKPTGYHVNFEGNFIPLNGPDRLTFKINVKFSTNQLWQEFKADFGLRPGRETWSLDSKASEQTLRFSMTSQDENYDRVYKFSDLRNPQYLIQEFQLPFPPQLLDALNLPAAGQTAKPSALGLVWEARDDWTTLGHISMRAYRLQARLFDRYRIIVMVSQVGEILRVELPDEWVLVVNDPLSNL